MTLPRSLGTLTNTEILAGDADGAPALVASGDRTLHYLTTIPDAAFLGRWLLDLAEHSGVRTPGLVARVPDGVEVAARGPFTFLLHHGVAPVEVALTAPAVDVLAGAAPRTTFTLPVGGTTILRKVAT